MVVPWSPGGGSDVSGRIIAAKLPEALGQQVVVDNRPGAAGNIGTALTAHAAADGYTILLADTGFSTGISLYEHPGYHPLKDFVQVNPASDIVDYSSNCGNMLSAVGPFAIEMGLIAAQDPATRVVIFNINTNSTIEVLLHTPGAQVTYDGDAEIAGVPGTASPVKENFAGAVGSKTGKLLPTGSVSEKIDGIEVTCIDVAVPMVVVPAAAVGKTGYESKAELDPDAGLIARLEKIRVEAGVRMGLGDCSELVIPKPVLVAAPRAGGTIASRDFVPFNCHATYSVTRSMALSTACILPGTVAHRLAKLKDGGRRVISIEHPGGAMNVEVFARQVGGKFVLEEANLLRTCRKLFEGQICIPSRVWNGSNKARDAMQLARAA